MVKPQSKISITESKNNFEEAELNESEILKIKKPIKTVHIIARLNVGGPARHVIWLTKAFQDDEHTSVLLTGRVPEGEQDMSYFADEHSVKPVYIEEMSRELSPKDIISLWKIYRYIQREKPDIIHTHTAKAGTVGRIAGFFYRWLTPRTLIGKPRPVKIIHTYHGHVFHSYYGRLKTNFFLLIEKTLARLATDKIIVISSQQYQEIHEQFGVGKKGQFQIIPIGIDVNVFADWKAKQSVLRREIGAQSDEILIGLVGRLTEVKNHSLFLKVIKLYKENADLPKLKFVIVGDGHLRENIENEAKTLGVEDFVVFVGNRNDADIFYAGLDIVALTSLNEGTPLSLLEAMANEKPVISTSVGGVVDLLGKVKSQQQGFLICERGLRTDSNNADGFYKALIYLANNENLKRKLAENGKKIVENQYSNERLISDIKNLNQELMRF